jgi:hypothetical protein
MTVGELWGRHAGEDIYIVGTGPSLRVFPLEYFDGKITIGLKQAWKYRAWTYCLTYHPEIIFDYVDYDRKCHADRRKNLFRTQWIVKKKAPLYELPGHEGFYQFDKKPGPNKLEAFRKASKTELYQGHGAQTTAINIAVHMGAKAIFLTGVDANSLGGEHHGHDQYVRFAGSKPESVYNNYYRGLALVRKVVTGELKIPIINLTALLGSEGHDEDYRRLCRELQLPPLPPPREISEENAKKLKQEPASYYEAEEKTSNLAQRILLDEEAESED